MEMPFSVQRIDHVVFRVRDLSRSIAFYQAVLGCEVVRRRAHLGLVLPLGLYFQFIRVPAALLIGMWVLLQLLFTWAGPGFGAVVWWAHLAGFGFGIVFALVSRGAVERRLRRRSY